MNMHNFKAGDRVRALDSAEGQFTKGKTYVVSRVDYSIGVVADDSGGANGWGFDKFEPAPLFAVGDKVLDASISGKGNGHAVVTEVYGNKIAVRWSDGSGGCLWPQTDFVLVSDDPEPLTIQAGRFYKTRDGRKVGPMSRHESGDRYWAAPECLLEFGQYWCMSGAFHEGKTAPYDLVAEWTDESAAAPASATFKIGDRVQFNGNQPGVSGLTGTIVARGDYHDWSVKLDRYSEHGHTCEDTIEDGYGRYANSADLRLVSAVATTNPAIVCLLRNGQPIPANKPHVHASVALATAEAERLAGVKPGDEFGVYELVARRSVPKPEPVYDHEWQRLAKSKPTCPPWRRDNRAAEALAKQSGIPIFSAEKAVADWLLRESGR